MDIQQAVEALGERFAVFAKDGAKALSQLALAHNAKVLDVGTGAGNFAIFLALQGFDVVTGEPADDESRYAGKDWAQNAEQVGVRDRIRFVAFDASDMGFESGTYDAVFFFGVLHHVDEQARQAVFREALRVVKQGGPVVYFEPRREMLEKVRVDDPDHPDPANPLDYAGALPISEHRVTGTMMDIYIYTAAGADTEA